MGYLEKNFILHERGTDEQLLPIDYPVPELGGKLVSIIPMTRGELLEMGVKRKEAIAKLAEEQKDKESGKTIEGATKRMQNRDETWEDFVLRHVSIPKLTKEELKDAKLITVEETRIEKRKVITKKKDDKEQDITTEEEVDVPVKVKEYKDIIMIFLDAIYTISGIPNLNDAEGEIKKNSMT